LCYYLGKYVHCCDFYFFLCFQFKFKIFNHYNHVGNYNLEFKPLTNKNVKIPAKNILSRITTQDSCLSRYHFRSDIFYILKHLGKIHSLIVYIGVSVQFERGSKYFIKLILIEETVFLVPKCRPQGYKLPFWKWYFPPGSWLCLDSAIKVVFCWNSENKWLFLGETKWILGEKMDFFLSKGV